MPIATPPCTWPSASSGLTRVPASSTHTIFWSSTSPVSMSTSTTAMWVPNGNVGPPAPPLLLGPPSPGLDAALDDRDVVPEGKRRPPLPPVARLQLAEPVVL